MTEVKGNSTIDRQGPASITALQCELRSLFVRRPVNRALAEGLGQLGQSLGAGHAVVHSRLGVHLLSEEWHRADHPIGPEVRELVNTALWESISAEEARCTRLPIAETNAVVVTAIMYDQDVEPSGGAALLLYDRRPEEIVQVMAQLEGLLGYLALLVGGAQPSQRRTAERHAVDPTNVADHPQRLAFSLVNELERRHGFALAAVGFVTGSRVAVAAITGVDEVRAANPGIALVRAAMEECLDRGEIVVHAGTSRGSAKNDDDARLHAQWSAANQGRAVASFPLVHLGEVVAVVSLTQGSGTVLEQDNVQVVAEEMANYAPLVPLTRKAVRGLWAHLRDSVVASFRRLAGRGHRRNLVYASAAALAAGWLAFGRLDYTLTVPCTVKAAEHRTIACPRAGVLAELFVAPGDRVRKGQLLASLDANDDFLQRAQLGAEIESLAALIDYAISKREPGDLRIHQAKQRSLMAQLAIVDARIAEAQVRAPQDGLILDGDLRERLGGRIEMGTPMFELARYDIAAVVLRVPEKEVLAANSAKTATFAPAAQPERGMPLENLRIAPASTIVDAHNVFLGEATVAIDLDMLPPGMEGFVHVNAGPRSAFWVLTHRLSDWLYLNFWL